MRVRGQNYIIGSGFAAFFSNAIWTNAHVVWAIDRALRDVSHLDPTPFALKSRSAYGGPDTYLLNEYYIHLDYDGTTSSPDVAAFFVDAEFTHAQLLPLLPRALAPYIRVGQPIGTMGFPGEISDPFATVPIATFKDGTISALRPFHNLSPTPENSRFVQHNLDLSAGTSGSPVFDHSGWVIAINNAGTDRIVFDQITGRPQRIPSGNLGFGIRVDELWRVGVPESILFTDEQHAHQIYRVGSICEPPASEEAILMTNVLINSAPLVAGIEDTQERKQLVHKVIYPVSRALVGKRLADQLQFPASRHPFTLLGYRLDQRIQRIKAWWHNEGPTDFATLLEASAYDDAGLSYRLPDHAHAEKSSRW